MFWLILAFSIFNVAIGFHATQLFRRERSARLRQLAEERWSEAIENQKLIAARTAVRDFNRREARDDIPATTSEVTSRRAEESESRTDESVELTTPAPSPSAIDPLEQPAVEELFYRSAELVNDLANIDHSIVSGQAGEAPTEEKLFEMWPRVAERSKPIKELGPRVADESPALSTSIESIAQHCDKLSSKEVSESDQESRMHQLRDLFDNACEFRDQCEDSLAIERGIDHRLNGRMGPVAFESEVARLAASPEEHCAIGLELDHIRELNSMYGARAVNAVLDRLPDCVEPHLPEGYSIFRRHGQHYLALVAGDITTASAAAEGIRQQISTTKFNFGDATIEATVSAGVVPIRLDGDILERVLSAMDKAKAEGDGRVALDHGDRIEFVEASSTEIEPMEVLLAP